MLEGHCMRRTLAVAVALVAVLGALPLTALGAEDPRFEATVPEPELQPGVQQELTLQLVNDAADVDDSVTTATNVEVTARDGSTPIEVVSGPRYLGTMTDGVPRSVSFRVEVPTDAPSGTYSIPLSITYEYDGDERETTTVRATVRIPERPIFSVTDVDSDLYQDETGLVRVTIANTGSMLANDTAVTVASRNPALAVGGGQSLEVFVGELPTGSETSFVVPVTTHGAVGGESYSLQLQPSYLDEQSVTRQAPPSTIGVQPATDKRFVVTEVSTAAIVGESGSLQVTLRNDGSRVLRDASVGLESVSGALSFEGQPTTTQFLGSWAPGETRTVTADVTVPPTGAAGEKSVHATVAAQFESGVRTNSGPYEVPVTVSPEQRFSVADVTLDMRGTSAVLTATLRNDGPAGVEDALVHLESTSPTVQVLEPTAPIGSLGAGQTTTVAFDLGVAQGANPGVRQFDAAVRYERNGDGPYRSDAIPLRANLPTDEDLFSVEPVNATFGIDATNEFEVRIRNEGDETLTDIRALLEVAPPYESQSASAYVASLDPGESTVVRFEVTTPEDAVPTTDALGVNLSAETETDHTVAAGPYLVPFTIAAAGAAASDTTALAVGAVAVILILGAGWWWLNR